MSIYIELLHIFIIYRYIILDISLVDIIWYIHIQNHHDISQYIVIYRFFQDISRYIEDISRYIAIYCFNFWRYITKIYRYIVKNYLDISRYISRYRDISWYIAIYRDISRDTVFPGKMSHIMTLFILEGKIMSMGLLGVFIVLNGVNRSESNISNTWSTSATAIFHF